MPGRQLRRMLPWHAPLSHRPLPIPGNSPGRWKARTQKGIISRLKGRVCQGQSAPEPSGTGPPGTKATSMVFAGRWPLELF